MSWCSLNSSNSTPRTRDGPEKSDFDELQAEMALLRDLGYRKFKPVQHGTVPGTSITTRTRSGEEINYVFASHASGLSEKIFRSPWLSFDEALQEYKRISLPGWYDTHASF